MTMKDIESLDSKYQELMNERYLRASVNHRKQMFSLLKQLPGPERLTKNWILKFLTRPSERTGKQLSADSVAQYLSRIQVVAKWIGRPEIVEGIKKPRTRKLSRADILDMSEIRRLIQSAPDSMTRALIHLIGETGLRIDEALSIHVEDIIADGSRQPIVDALGDKAQIMGRMWKIEIKRSKTFVRSVYAYDSTPSLHAWLMDHPVKKGPLFVSTKRIRVDGVLQWKEISYSQAYEKITRAYVHAGYQDESEIKRLKLGIAKGETSLEKYLTRELAKPAVPKRRVHVFRHAAGTQMAKDRVHPKMMNRAMGWTPGSHAADIYIHLIDEDVEEEMRRRYGLSDSETHFEPGIHSWICPICGNMNPPTTGICISCPPRPQPMEEELERMRGEIEKLKIQRSEDLGKLALELIEKMKRELK